MKNGYQRVIKTVTVVVALLFVLSIGVVYADGDRDDDNHGGAQTTYRITVENLTQGQPFSPIVAATHRPVVHMFKVGRRASDELETIAEDGNNGPMVERLSRAPRRVVIDFFGDDELVLPGASISFELKAAGQLTRLSLAGMLVCTNDGFTGLDAGRLPERGSKEYYLKVYDAGTEKNTELAAHVPCLGGTENEAVDTNRRIRPHRGIQEVGDLTEADHGWTDPVAKVVVERID